MELKTKRLRIVPLDIEQMALLCEGQEKLNTILGLSSDNDVVQDEHLKAAFEEMYRLCLEHPKDYLWYTNWQIILQGENKSIGSIGFRGPVNNRHEVEVGYGIDKKWQNQGYATEALKAIYNWAFLQNVYYIRAQTENHNEASKKVLVKCGFKQVDNGDVGLIFELEKPASSSMSIYTAIGMSLGLCFGTALSNLSIGIGIGLAMGVALGAALDANDRKKRKRA